MTSLVFTCSHGLADDWPQWLGPQRDGVWRETEIVEKLPAKPTYRWRVRIGSGYAGPAVANGRVFVMDRKLAVGAEKPNDPFAQAMIPGKERVVCLDEDTGEQLWVHEYACAYTVSYSSGPRATPTIDGEQVYVLGAEGNFKCLQVSDGSVVWEKDFKEDFGTKTATWGWASPPLIDGDNVISIAGGEGSLVVAFDKKTGKEVWRSLSAKEPGYGTPMIYEINGRRQLIVWHPEAIVALNPNNGEVFWEHEWPIRYALTAPTPRLVNDKLFFTAFYNGSKLLDLGDGEPKVKWASPKISEKDTSILHSIMSTPIIDKGVIYGAGSYGELRGIDLHTGERLWEEMGVIAGPKKLRWGNAFFVQHKPDDKNWIFNDDASRFFLFTEQGDLVLATMSQSGYQELGRLHIIDADNNDARTRKVVWSHPAFANGHVIARNDSEIVSVSLKK